MSVQDLAMNNQERLENPENPENATRILVYLGRKVVWISMVGRWSGNGGMMIKGGGCMIGTMIMRLKFMRGRLAALRWMICLAGMRRVMLGRG